MSSIPEPPDPDLSVPDDIMKIFTITFIVDIEAEDEDDAVEEARQLISNPSFEPHSVEEFDEPTHNPNEDNDD